MRKKMPPHAKSFSFALFFLMGSIASACCYDRASEKSLSAYVTLILLALTALFIGFGMVDLNREGRLRRRLPPADNTSEDPTSNVLTPASTSPM